MPVQQFTHQRKLPLPTTLYVDLGGDISQAQYQGHGKSQIAYLLKVGKPHTFSGKVLNLVEEDDPEPYTFQELASTSL